MTNEPEKKPAWVNDLEASFAEVNKELSELLAMKGKAPAPKPQPQKPDTKAIDRGIEAWSNGTGGFAPDAADKLTPEDAGIQRWAKLKQFQTPKTQSK